MPILEAETRKLGVQCLFLMLLPTPEDMEREQ